MIKIKSIIKKNIPNYVLVISSVATLSIVTTDIIAFKEFTKVENDEQIIYLDETDIKTIGNSVDKNVIFDDDNKVVTTEVNLVDNMTCGEKIEYEIVKIDDRSNYENEDLYYEAIDDNISIYFVNLQEINENNPLKNINMEEYFNNNYEELLYSSNDFADVKCEYAALAYQRLQKSNVNIDEVLVELENIMILQTVPTEISDSDYNKAFKNLISTLNEGESVYDIYFPFAKQLHLVKCNMKHGLEYGITTCENLENEYSNMTK